MKIIETHVDVESNCLLCEPIPVDTDCDTLAELYFLAQREYGRCISKMYVDTDNGPLHIGYVFQARREYTDCKDTYLHEVWVGLAE